MTTLLELDGVAARYGPVQALHDVSLVVREGEVVAVLGANGAGKTTTLRAISGTVSRSGTIELDGKQLKGGPGGGGQGRHRARSRGPRHLRRPHRDREPQARRVHASRPLGEGGHRAHRRVLPVDHRARRPARRHALRRRAADARARPRADEPPAAAAPRRAVARARADDRARVLPDRPRAQREGGPHRARRRAGRADRAQGVECARTCSRSAASRSPGRATSCGTTSPCDGATWAT